MKSPFKLIENFVGRVRARLNRHQFANATLWALLTAAVMVLAAAMVYVLKGHAVPKPFYLIGGGFALVLAIVLWIAQRYTQKSAAQFADEHFDLKDAVNSSLDFDTVESPNEFHKLQTNLTARKVGELKVNAIRYQWPAKLLAATAILLGVAALTAFKEPSQKVLDRLRVEKATKNTTGKINPVVAEKLGELEEELTPEMAEEIGVAKLKEMVLKLQETKDPDEALRQYAKLERQLMEAAAKLNQRGEEELLTRAGEELKQSPETKELGEELKGKKYEKAAQKLGEMEPAELDKEKLKLDEARKQLAKLKAAAQRMAAARGGKGASGSAAGGQQNPGQSQSKANQTSGAAGSTGQASGAGGGNGLGQAIDALDQAAGALDKEFRNAQIKERQHKGLTEADRERLRQLRELTKQELAEMMRKLQNMQTRRNLQNRLRNMADMMARGQEKVGQGMGGQGQSKFKNGVGGGGAGDAISGNKREAHPVPTLNPGNVTQLKGIKGTGESNTSTEGADEGSGTATRQVTDQERDFQRQLENFVSREDVPDEVKEGVKQYFETINRIGTEAAVKKATEGEKEN